MKSYISNWGNRFSLKSKEAFMKSYFMNLSPSRGYIKFHWPHRLRGVWKLLWFVTFGNGTRQGSQPPTTKGAAKLLVSQIFPKTAWKWKQLDRGWGARSKCYYVDRQEFTSVSRIRLHPYLSTLPASEGRSIKVIFIWNLAEAGINVDLYQPVFNPANKITHRILKSPISKLGLIGIENVYSRRYQTLSNFKWTRYDTVGPLSISYQIHIIINNVSQIYLTPSPGVLHAKFCAKQKKNPGGLLMQIFNVWGKFVSLFVGSGDSCIKVLVQKRSPCFHVRSKWCWGPKLY